MDIIRRWQGLSRGSKPKLKPIDKLVLKTAVRFFLMFVILGKALKGVSLILWLEGSIITL